MSDLCMLDLLKVDRPLKESCFSEDQIQNLYDLWKRFLIEKFVAGQSTASDQERKAVVEKARSDVERLYSNAISIKEKYQMFRFSEDGLGEHERKWVMDHDTPTPFIEYLRKMPPVMDNLRMSFKPDLLHGGNLEAADFIAIFLRMILWFKKDQERTLNIIGISDPTASGVSIDSMIGNMRTNWIACRFHLGLIQDDNRWRAVLIDRIDKKFEYYDPRGQPLDLTETRSGLAQNVRKLYEAARQLDPTLITESIHKTMRGFGKHQKDGSEECGMYVLLYINTRVTLRKSFTEFANEAIDDSQCKSLKSTFFNVSKLEDKSVDVASKVSSKIKYGDYDVRLAGMDFVRYMNRLIELYPVHKDSLTQKQSEFLKMITTPGDYLTIRVMGAQIQQVFLSVLPQEFKLYSGSDIWFSMIHEIIADPLTQRLREEGKSKHKDRSKNTKRISLALEYFKDIVGWSQKLGARPEYVTALTKQIRAMIDQTYIPVLAFDKDTEFSQGMSAEEFVKNSMKRKETVAFGVHFMREVLRFVQVNLKLVLQTDLNTKYSFPTKIVTPVSTENVEAVVNNVQRCETAIANAYALLRNTFAERLSQSNTGSGQIMQMPLPAQSMQPMQPVQSFDSFNSFGQVTQFDQSNQSNQFIQPDLTSFSTPTGFVNSGNKDLIKLKAIVEKVKSSIVEKTFMNENKLGPYDFPLEADKFTYQYSIPVPEESNVKLPQIIQLLHDDVFMKNYATQTVLFCDKIASTNNVSVNDVIRVFGSLRQFSETAAKNLPTRQNLQQNICFLITRLHNAISGSTMASEEQILQVLSVSTRITQVCQGKENPAYSTIIANAVLQFNNSAS